MAAKRHERTRARRAALQVLYTSEITEASPADIAEKGCLLTEDGLLSAYAEELVRGVAEHRDAIDGYLTSTSENWALARMPIVDRSILRLATYEMMYAADVPTSVTINEAVELAKDFGGEDESPRFVNGVLGRIARQLEEREGNAADQTAVADAPATADGEVSTAPIARGEAATAPSGAAQAFGAVHAVPEPTAAGAAGAEEAAHGN